MADIREDPSGGKGWSEIQIIIQITSSKWHYQNDTIKMTLLYVHPSVNPYHFGVLA